MKKEIWKLGGQIRREPFRLDLKVQFRKMRKYYNQLISKKRRFFKDEITAKMENVYRSNPSHFWEVFNDLKGRSSERVSSISLTEWAAFSTETMNDASGIFEDNLKMFDQYVDA